MSCDGIDRIVVVGGGIMGGGIAQVAAQAGFQVTIVDLSDEILERRLTTIDSSLARLVKSERLDAETAAATRRRLSTSTHLADVARESDHVIEAIPEDRQLKQALLSHLDEVCRPEVILATNTSQMSITMLAASTRRPDRVIGTHWFNPPPIMRLIEVVRGMETSDATLATTLALAHAFGKETIVCKKDSQGFLTARLGSSLHVEAVRCLEEGVADVDDINRACVLAFNHAMGPLDTVDLGGLDTALAAWNELKEHYGERFLAPQIMHTLVSAGHLGRKTGRGFSRYDKS